MSARKEIANKFAQYICENKIKDEFGGIVTLVKNNDKHFYVVAFNKIHNTKHNLKSTNNSFIKFSGTIRIYSPKFIQITGEYYTGKVLEKINLIFETETLAIKYFQLRFIEHLKSEADQVQHRETREKKQ